VTKKKKSKKEAAKRQIEPLTHTGSEAKEETKDAQGLEKNVTENDNLTGSEQLQDLKNTDNNSEQNNSQNNHQNGGKNNKKNNRNNEHVVKGGIIKSVEQVGIANKNQDSEQTADAIDIKHINVDGADDVALTKDNTYENVGKDREFTRTDSSKSRDDNTKSVDEEKEPKKKKK